MKIERVSPLTGHTNVRDINITEAQLYRWQIGPRTLSMIAPDLSEADREFIVSGLTPDDWQDIADPSPTHEAFSEQEPEAFPEYLIKCYV